MEATSKFIDNSCHNSQCLNSLSFIRFLQFIDLSKQTICFVDAQRNISGTGSLLVNKKAISRSHVRHPFGWKTEVLRKCLIRNLFVVSLVKVSSSLCRLIRGWDYPFQLNHDKLSFHCKMFWNTSNNFARRRSLKLNIFLRFLFLILFGCLCFFLVIPALV